MPADPAADLRDPPPRAALKRRGLLLATLGVAAGCSPRSTVPSTGYTLLDGSAHSTDGWRGKVVLVNFWATTCASCIAEMPDLMATHAAFRTRGFDTLAVAMAWDEPARVAHFAQSRRLPFGVAFDGDGALAAAFGDVRLTPTSVVVDADGRIARRLLGRPDFQSLHALLDGLLQAG